jgi:hypothetical protein
MRMRPERGPVLSYVKRPKFWNRAWSTPVCSKNRCGSSWTKPLYAPARLVVAE